MFTQHDFSFVHKYFNAEKQESLVFLIVGFTAISLAAALFFFIKINPSFYKGAAIPLLVIGILQAAVGYTVFARSEKQKIDVAYNMGISGKNFVQTKELPRMITVMKSFVVYRYVEIALAVAGLLLVFLFRNNPDRLFWYGLGLALAIQSVLMLGADYFAEKRGHEYVKELKEFMIL